VDYLVTMTTHVPDGTPPQAVDDIRAREDAHSRDLAQEGHLLRLWRPPLAPGEWRTLGLFAAGDPGELDQVLASMPLRVWRTDEVQALAPHPNDPAAPPGWPAGTEQFLVTMTIRVPAGTQEGTISETEAREAVRARELAGAGHLLRLWTLPLADGALRTLGLWSAAGEAEMPDIIGSLPMYPWMTVATVPLSRHPSDPVPQ
jgi:muconolactone delta-isomerase